MEIHRLPRVLEPNGFDFESGETYPNENADPWVS